MERGPVPPSASSSCTYIGGDNRDQYRRCPPSTRRRWFHGHPTHIYIYDEIMDYLFCEIIYFLLWAKSMMMMMLPPPCTSSATFNIYIYKETTDCFMFFCFEQEVWSIMINDDFMRYDQRWRYALDVIVLRDYLFSALHCGLVSSLFWLSRLIINYASDFNPPQKRYLLFALNKYCGLVSNLFCCLVWSITQVISTRQKCVVLKKYVYMFL